MSAARIFALSQELSPESLERAVDEFFKDLLDESYGPLDAAFDALNVTSNAEDYQICEDLHSATHDEEIAAAVNHAADALRPLIRVVIATTVRELAFVVSPDDHVTDGDLAAYHQCALRDGPHLEIAEYRRIGYHLQVCQSCAARFDVSTEAVTAGEA